MSCPSAREWGRAQATKAPFRDEARWQRISRILGVDLVEPDGEKQPLRSNQHADVTERKS